MALSALKGGRGELLEEEGLQAVHINPPQSQVLESVFDVVLA